MAGWYILFIATCILFAVAQFVFLPKIISVLRYRAAEPRGRGRKIVKEVDGESILYDAAPEISHVIPQYILSERGGEKRLICKLNGKVRTVDYDVALFDKEGKIFKVLNVREEVERAGYACEVALPAETEYVSIYLNAADGLRRGIGAPSGKVPKVRFFIYIAAFAAAVFAAVWLLRLCIAHIFGGLFDEIYLADSSALVETLTLYFVVVLLDVAFALIFVKIKNRKKRGRKSRAKS